MDLWIRSQDKFTMQVVTKGIQIIDYHGLKEKLENEAYSKGYSLNAYILMKLED